jgi:phage FluMu protein Com
MVVKIYIQAAHAAQQRKRLLLPSLRCVRSADKIREIAAMPIRFRCHHCNQLLGIAHRKAGMMVQCPTCHAQILVPHPGTEGKAEVLPAKPIPDAPAPLFERSDFEAILQNPIADKPAVPATPVPPLAFAAEVPSSSPLVTPSGGPRVRPPGLALSPRQATLLTVGVILLVALAFGAGLLVGYCIGG